MLTEDEVTRIRWARHEGGVYYPNLCVARVSEEKLSTHKKRGLKDDGRLMMVADFTRQEVPTMVDLLDRHRSFVHGIEMYTLKV